MKKTLLALFFLVAVSSAFAQLGNTTLVPFPGAPSGPCGLFQQAINQANGNFYGCPAGSWVLIGGVTGGTVTNVASGTGLTGGPITATGTISLAVPVTVANGGSGATTLTGILKGNGTSAFTIAASADVIALFSGTCNTTTFLRGDGSCSAAGTGTMTSSGFTSGTPLAAFSTATNITPATSANVIALFSTCSGTQYLGADGSCHAGGTGTMTSSGFTSGTPLSAFSTATNLTPATFANVVALFGSGSCSGFLKNDGTCATGGTGNLNGTLTAGHRAVPSGAAALSTSGPTYYTDQLSGATVDARLQTCLSALPGTGGVCDMSAETALTTSATAANGIISQPGAIVILPPVTLTLGNTFFFNVTGANAGIFCPQKWACVLDASNNGSAGSVTLAGNGSFLNQVKVIGGRLNKQSGNEVVITAPQNAWAWENWIVNAGQAAITIQNNGATAESQASIRYNIIDQSGSAAILVNNGNNSSSTTLNDVSYNLTRDANVNFNQNTQGTIGAGCSASNCTATPPTAHLADHNIFSNNIILNQVLGSGDCNNPNVIPAGGNISGWSGDGVHITLTFTTPMAAGDLYTVGQTIVLSTFANATINGNQTVTSRANDGTTVSFASAQTTSTGAGLITYTPASTDTGCSEGIQTTDPVWYTQIKNNYISLSSKEGIAYSGIGSQVIGNYCDADGQRLIGSVTPATAGCIAWEKSTQVQASPGYVGDTVVVGNVIHNSSSTALRYAMQFLFNSGATSYTMQNVIVADNVIDGLNGSGGFTNGILINGASGTTTFKNFRVSNNMVSGSVTTPFNPNSYANITGFARLSGNGFNSSTDTNPTAANCVQFDANHQPEADSGNPCGTPAGSTLSAQYNAGSGAFGGATLGTNRGTYLVGRQNTTQGTAVAPIDIQAGACTRSVSGTATDTVLYSDALPCTIFHARADTTAVTETIPTPTTLNNANAAFIYENDSNQTDILSPTTFTIALGHGAAASTLNVPQNVKCAIQIDPSVASVWDAACAPIATSASGSGTVTVVGAGNLTSTAFVTGGGTQTLQTPSATSTLSAAGNASFAGTLAATGHVTFEGVTSAGATGTSNLVFSTSPVLTTPRATTINDANGNPFLVSSATASAVDGITVTTAATANPATVTIGTSGTDTNVNLQLASKGTAVVEVGAGPAITTLGTSGGSAWGCGTAPTNIASTELQYCDSANQPHAMSGTTDLGIVSTQSQTAILTADWTCGTGGTNTTCVAAGTIGTLTFTLPLEAKNWSFDCNLVVGQATAATANNWDIQTATNGATNTMSSWQMSTAATAYASGALTGQASGTTSVDVGVTWTLGGTATKMPVHWFGTIEGASASGTVLNFQLKAPTVADLVTIYRGSSCRIF